MPTALCLHAARPLAAPRPALAAGRAAARPPPPRRQRGRLAAAAAAEDSTPSDAEVVPLAGAAAAAARDPRLAGLGRVLVAGATGGVGRAVVEQLLAAGIPVRALVRSAERARAVLPPTDPEGLLEISVANVYQYQDLPAALAGCGAVVCATGPTDRWNPAAPYQVDFVGTANLVAAAERAGGVQRFVLVSSIGADDPLFPLNLFFGVLLMKKQGELALQRSGLPHAILRPGGLVDAPRRGAAEGGVVVGGADAFGLPPRRRPGSVLRAQVAAAAIAALVEPAAAGKVVELVQEVGAPARPWAELFASV